MGRNDFDEGQKFIEQEVQEIKSLLMQIAKNTQQRRGAGGGGAGSTGSGGRSALAGGGSARRGGGRGFGGKLGKALGRKLIGRAGGPAGAAAASIAGAVDDAIITPAKKIVKDTVFNGMRTGAQFGGDVNAFQGAANQAKSNIPLIGQNVSRVIDPINRAAARTNAITSLIARGGGTITDQDRKQLFQRFKEEETRAEKESVQVKKMAAKDIGSEETTSAVNEELSNSISRLADSISSAFGGG